MSTPSITAQPWTSLPAHFRRSNGTSEHSQNQKRGAPLDSFLEGPCYVSELDTLFLTDIPYGRIFTVDCSTKEWTLVVEYDGEPNGLAWDGLRKRLVIADFKQGILALHLPVAKTRLGKEPFPLPKDEIKTLVTRYKGERLKGPNDLIISPKTGHIFFTDQGMSDLLNPSGRVFRLDPTTLQLTLLIPSAPSPNGLVLTHSESALLVAMTRDNGIWYVPFYPDGSVQRVGRWSSYFGSGGPDGMTLDEEGNVCVAHSSLGRVFVHDAHREEIRRIVMPEGMGMGRATTNMTFGGEGGRTIFVVESGSGTVLTVQWHCAGWSGEGRGGTQAKLARM
ncbi:SMP-30/gluconolactonase/LRE family protein [Aspergillus stella-maris]|uniref:SMP-30/gluconolactonase/LRE family protein n=1 Tax=Aspergillus stella-maris TaxID=1810926 RepID=UPI003CCCE838